MTTENAAPAAEPATPAPASELQPGAAPPVDGGAAPVVEGEAAPVVDAAPPVETEEEKSKKRERFDKRFSELSRTAREAELKAARLEGELNALRRNAQPSEPAPQAPAAAPLVAPDPKDAAKYPQGEFDARYIADLAKFELRKEMADEAEATKRSEGEAAARAALAEGKARLDSTIETARAAAEGDDGQYFENAPRFLEYAMHSLPTATVDLITESEFPVHVAELLGRDKGMRDAFLKLNPLGQARYIGGLEAQIRPLVKPNGARPASPPPPPPPAPTPSPAAMPTAPGSGGVAPFDPNKASFDEYKAARESGRFV